MNFVPFWDGMMWMRFGRAGEVVRLLGKCDWDSPLWPRGYPIIPDTIPPVQRTEHGPDDGPNKTAFDEREKTRNADLAS